MVALEKKAEILRAVFCGFSVFYLKEELKWNHLVGFGLMVGAVPRLVNFNNVEIGAALISDLRNE